MSGATAVIPVFGSREREKEERKTFSSLETVIESANRQIQNKCGDRFHLEYIDAEDIDKLKKFPDVLEQIEKGGLKPRHLMIRGELVSFPISMASIEEEFQRLAEMASPVAGVAG